ncbi:unnamed protein product [Prunus armeniaca]
MVTTQTCLCCYGGRWSAPFSRLGLGASRSAFSCLASQDRGVLTQRLPQASNLLQGSLPGGFPHPDPSCLDSGASRSTLPCLADQDQVASNLLQGSLPGGFPRLDPSCLDSGASRSAPLCLAGQDQGVLTQRHPQASNPFQGGLPGGFPHLDPGSLTAIVRQQLPSLSGLLVKPDQVLILEADDGRIQNGWYFRCDLGDISYLSDLSLALLGGQPDSWESARMVLTRMTFWGGFLAAASRSSICWMAFFATNSVQWPSLTSSSRCIF